MTIDSGYMTEIEASRIRRERNATLAQHINEHFKRMASIAWYDDYLIFPMVMKTIAQEFDKLLTDERIAV